MLATDGSETSRSSVSDLYFDDEFSSVPLQDQNRHLRLNATIGLDNQYNADLSNALFVSPYVASKEHPKTTTGLISSSSKCLIRKSSSYETDTTIAHAGPCAPANESSKDLSWSSSTSRTDAVVTNGTISSTFSGDERNNGLDTNHIRTITGYSFCFLLFVTTDSLSTLSVLYRQCMLPVGMWEKPIFRGLPTQNSLTD